MLRPTAGDVWVRCRTPVLNPIVIDGTAGYPAINTIMRGGQRVVWARVYPQTTGKDGELAASVGELSVKENWKIEELHTEEGRLDDVFRAITLPDTAKEQK